MSGELRDIQPIWAREGEIVEIHWRTREGEIVTVRVTCPPKAVRDAKKEQS